MPPLRPILRSLWDRIGLSSGPSVAIMKHEEEGEWIVKEDRLEGDMREDDKKDGMEDMNVTEDDMPKMGERMPEVLEKGDVQEDEVRDDDVVGDGTKDDDDMPKMGCMRY